MLLRYIPELFTNTYNKAHKIISCISEGVHPKFSPVHLPSKSSLAHILLLEFWKGSWFFQDCFESFFKYSCINSSKSSPKSPTKNFQRFFLHNFTDKSYTFFWIFFSNIHDSIFPGYSLFSQGTFRFCPEIENNEYIFLSEFVYLKRFFKVFKILHI